MMDQLAVGWKVIIRDIVIVLMIVVVLLWAFKAPKKGDEIPLTPPESLYTPNGSTQTIK